MNEVTKSKSVNEDSNTYSESANKTDNTDSNSEEHDKQYLYQLSKIDGTEVPKPMSLQVKKKGSGKLNDQEISDAMKQNIKDTSCAEKYRNRMNSESSYEDSDEEWNKWKEPAAGEF